MPLDSNKEKNVKFNIANTKWAIVGSVNAFFDKYYNEDSEKMMDTFAQHYDKLLQQHEKEDITGLSRLNRLISEFKPALSSVLQPGEEFNGLCEAVSQIFNVILEGVKLQMENKIRRPNEEGPVMPGSDPSVKISYFCTVCEHHFEIPEDMKEQLLNSSEKIELPKHHEKEMEIRIIGGTKVSLAVEKDIESEEEVGTASSILAKLTKFDDIGEYLIVLSVGIDIGSSTSHLVFSRLTLRRERSFLNLSHRFFLHNREIIYEGTIIDTPLLDRYTIDIDAVVKFCEEEYKKAGIETEMVDTGAVIVTGETAKKQNAAEIVRRLSSESGKFVSAAAGPNFESLLGAMGSGVVELSNKNQQTIMNIDVGGGTSNIAIASKGHVHSTSCINVGGRLLGIDKNHMIWRIDEPSEFLMQELNMKYKLGDIIPVEEVRTISREYAKALIEVMRGPAKSEIAKKLMMTDDLDFSIPIDRYSFSGGVAEMIYGNDNVYDDIGKYLAEEIKILMKEFDLPIIEPENKIRATVIGAGAFSLSVSGSTCYFDKSIEFPLENIPVIPINVRKDEFSPKKLKEEVNLAFKKHDMPEGEELVALYFKDPIHRSAHYLLEFAKAIEKALPNSIANNKMIILIFEPDMGGSVGISLRRETTIQNNLICMDELFLDEGDWIDIGAPLYSGQAFPVTVKSLVFNKNE
ncbi:MAG: ethanolamine ammonia-lyase reactivating factor EutA [Candidatus Heimdallarchaeota archaeon]|nr:ethanolamine ammonia-lyase reactivating factor EutA [Candidatus Heimdallarchaeota archaeon]